MMGARAMWLIREGFAPRDPETIARRQRERLARIVSFARERSLYYRDLYRDVEAGVSDVTRLPVTSKSELMQHFDGWATDREVTSAQAFAFAKDPKKIGERFLGRYTVATTSGTTGVPGVFVLDEHAMATVNAVMLRMLRSRLGLGGALRLMARGGRMAVTIAPGMHSATAVAAVKMRRSSKGRSRVLALSVHTPLAELVPQLNAFRPALLAPYASIGKLLAEEQRAGRLDISPVLIALAAEGLSPDEYDRIAKTFGATVINSYGATECPFLSFSCSEGWLHVSADWAILEPVDEHYQPVPIGQYSHTALLTNLANRVQPILRYDLGDSVMQRPDRCSCGNPLPAVRVQGRTADVLRFHDENDLRIAIPPLVFATLVDPIPGLLQYQLVQASPTSLRVHVLHDSGADAERTWDAVHVALSRVLSDHGLANVNVERAQEPPKQSTGGKFRRIIPLS